MPTYRLTCSQTTLEEVVILVDAENEELARKAWLEGGDYEIESARFAEALEPQSIYEIEEVT